MTDSNTAEKAAAPGSLSPELLHILHHSLGCDKYGRPENRHPSSDDWHGCYRNRFVTGPGGKDFDLCRTLVELGFMKDWGPSALCGGAHNFSVTEEGYQAMRKDSPTPPKLTRSQ